ncbi:MAG TPA: EAL domain-containing protein [Xanthobacteraceae bacterium]|nr:EAL domain-containing protein [Xanthobacteraceae bacterium]
MYRLAAIFVAVCMVLIAGSIAAVSYLYFRLSPAEAALVGLTALTGMALYNAVSTRLRDRSDVGDQIADLSRLTADLARHMAEIKRQVAAAETKVDSAVNKVRAAVEPVTTEMGELGALVKQLAETVAAHETALAHRANATLTALPHIDAAPPMPAFQAPPLPKTNGAGHGHFAGMETEAVVAAIAEAVEANRIDLYLHPIVTLPQRKVRFYEALSRLRTAAGEQIAAAEFVSYAEAAGLMPKIDNLALFRCVQILRRLLLKNREIGLFCNVSAATLSQTESFAQFSDFMEANRALAPSLHFEFTQSAFRAMGPIEYEALAALADKGFRFSLDHISDLRIEPQELANRGFRFLKVPVSLLLSGANAAASDIDPADLADLLARYNIDLVAERIEAESSVVDILDFDVRFGQGFLFSQPRPVRPEAMQGNGERGAEAQRTERPAGAVA